MAQAPVNYPKWDIRRDPFTSADESVLVSDEEYTIPAASKFYVQLDEVPRQDDPSTMIVYLTDLLNEDLDLTETIVTVTNGALFTNGDVIQIDNEQMLVGGVAGNDLSVTRHYGGTAAATHTNQTRFFLTAALTEVLLTPVGRQYWVHYGSTSVPYKAGLVQFPNTLASVTVWVTYYKTGHYNWAEFVGNSVNASTLSLKSFYLLAEDNAEVHNGTYNTWYLMKTITFTTTARDVLLWIEFEHKMQSGAGSISTKVILDGGSTIYSCGKWTGLAGDNLTPYSSSSGTYAVKDNLVPGKLFEWDAAFSEAGNCPLDISALTPGSHTITVYGYGFNSNQNYLKNFKIYSTRL